MLGRVSAANFAINGSTNVHQPHHTSNDTISNDCRPRWRKGSDASSKLQSKTAIDYSKSYKDSAKPDVAIRPDNTPRMLLEHHVVQEAQDRLEEEQDEEDDPDDGMSVVDHAHVCGDVHSKTKRGDVDEVREELEQRVDEPETAEVANTDEDGADGEQEDKGGRCEDGVGDDDLVS